MSAESHDKIFNVLLGIQKQIGDVSRETGEQTEKLDALNAKVAIANGRTGKNEAQIANIREWGKYVLGGGAVIIVVGLYAATMYIKEVATQAANKVVYTLEEKYNIKIDE